MKRKFSLRKTILCGSFLLVCNLAHATQNAFEIDAAGNANFHGNLTTNGINVEQYLVPQGGIIMWSGHQVPNGWSLCDGQNNTPNLSGRFIRSTGINNGNTYVIGQQGGYDDVTLQIAQLPSHNHSFTTNPGGEHTHQFRFHQRGFRADGNGGGNALTDQFDDYNTVRTTESSGLHTHTGTTDLTGQNQPVNITPSYYVLAFIKKN